MDKTSSISVRILIHLCLLFLFYGINGQKPFLETIHNFDEYNQKTLNEQVYLHIDREVYSPGDTLWFKGYIRNKSSFRKTGFSNTLHILMADNEGRIIDHHKFLISNSSSKGQFEISHDLEDGIYYVTAYSNWMRNFSSDEIFKKRILIHNEFKTSYKLVPAFNQKYYLPGDSMDIRINCYDNLWREVENVSFLYSVECGTDKVFKGNSNIFNGYKKEVSLFLPDGINQHCQLELFGNHNGYDLDHTYELPVHFNILVNFYPEGGDLINGMMNKVAFNSVFPDGRPVDIEGEIVNEKGDVFTAVKTQHNGMGTFIFLPEENEKYYLSISKPAGISKKYYLPQGEEKGWLLTASSRKGKITAGIRHNHSDIDTCLLTLMIRGYNFYSRVVPVEKSRSFVFPTDTFPSGIGVLTLFDKNMLPRAERLVFVNYYKRHQVNMETDLQNYLPREKVRLSIEITNQNGEPVNGEYSLSVMDAELGLTDRFDEPNIISGNHFAHEIKGKVIDPDYYFKTGSKEEQNNLDLLLMTQGWRKYNYIQKVRNVESLPKPANQNIISGHLKKKRFFLEPKRTKGKLNIYYGGSSAQVKTDDNGNFAFIPSFQKNANPNMLLSGFDKNGKDNVIVNIDSNQFMKKLDDYLSFLMDSLSASGLSKIYTYETLEKEFSLNLENHVWIDAVSIKAKKMQKNEDMDSQIMESILDKRKAMEYTLETSDDVLSVLNYMGLPVKYYASDGIIQYYYQGKEYPVYWYVDGFPRGTNYNQEISFMRPEAIEELTILRGPQANAYYSSTIVAFIQTDPEEQLTMIQKYRMANKRVLDGYIMAKEFYKPAYDTQAKKQSRVPDVRKTIHWEPDLLLDSNGRTSVTFYNADRYTRVICKIQGISEEGIPAYADSEYQVVVTK